MPLVQKSFRVDSDDLEKLGIEAKRRGYESDSALVRLFISNGLADFSPLADKLVDLTKQVVEMSQQIRDLSAANLFLATRDIVLREGKREGESDDQFNERQQERLLSVPQKAILSGRQLADLLPKIEKKQER